MILNAHTYRTLKNALALVPGAPGSSHLGEAMAAAWGFRSFHKLNDYLTRSETDLNALPAHHDIFPDQMIDRLMDLGASGETGRSLALTMLVIQEGDFVLEMIEDIPEIQGARAYRFDQTTVQWRDAITEAAKVLAEYAPGRAWHLPLKDRIDWRHPQEESRDIARAMRIIEHEPMEAPRISDSRDYEGLEFELTDLAAARGGCLPVSLAEHVLTMCQQMLPEGAEHLVIGPTGVVVLYPGFEICLVEYDTRELQMHAPVMLLHGPEMI